MTDIQILGLAVTLYYLWDCLLWAPPRTFVFTTRIFSGWSRSESLQLLRRRHLLLHFLSPIPPAGQTFSGTIPAVSFSETSVVSANRFASNPGNRPAMSGAHIPWDKIESIHAEGNQIKINKTLFFTAAHTSEAFFIARWMQRIRKAGSSKRGEAIRDFTKEIFNQKKAKKLVEEISKPLKIMRWLSILLWMLLYTACPVAHWRFGLSESWMYLTGTALLLMWAQAYVFRKTHKKHLPDADQERFVSTLSCILLLPSAIRIPDHFTKALLLHFHPLTTASNLVSKDNLRITGEAILRDLHHPLPAPAHEEEQAEETIESFHKLMLKQTEAFLEKQGFKSADLLQTPAPTDPEHKSGCPRCKAQYVMEKGSCEDCGGMELEPLSK